MSRHNFERVRDVSGEPHRVEPPTPAPLSVLREGVAPSPDLLLTEILLPILERVNASLDELEAVVARIAEAPHG